MPCAADGAVGKLIAAAVPSITLTTPDGRTVTRKVEDKKNLEGVDVGDTIDVTRKAGLTPAQLVLFCGHAGWGVS